MMSISERKKNDERYIKKSTVYGTIKSIAGMLVFFVLLICVYMTGDEINSSSNIMKMFVCLGTMSFVLCSLWLLYSGLREVNSDD